MKTNTHVNTNPDRTPTALSRRSILIAALGVPALALVAAACGDKTKQSGATTAAPPTTGSTGTDTDATTPPPASTPAGAIEHPTGADDVIFRSGLVGGFTTPGFAFTNVPSVMVSGDGRLFTLGATTMIYPGQLLPAINERSITEDGIQKLLALADSAGLLAPAPDYAGNIQVADAPDTQVIISANGETYTHQAMALGFEEVDESPARKALRTFTEVLRDLPAVVGAQNLGADAPLVPTNYRIQTMVVTEDELVCYDPAPTIVDWTLADVSLAGASECTVVTAEQAGTTFTDAKQDTFFRETVAEAATIYRISAVAMLPGDVC